MLLEWLPCNAEVDCKFILAIILVLALTLVLLLEGGSQGIASHQ